MRRNRRRERSASDHALFALHKYYLRAELMRGQYAHSVETLKAKHGPTEWMKSRPTNEHFLAQMYLDYWWAALCVVIEGYEKLSLQDEIADELIKSPLMSKLRRYRSGVYHFSEKYFDLDKIALVTIEEGKEWAIKLHMALGHFLLRELNVRKEQRLAGGN